ncbi:sensor histidine kinase [Herbidospora galbida]|uniref:Sensor histidine kinase n=1 Tax=Herbidospora galbida TaxID=2575442 RepID=A0A4V6XBB3_9ACTN|nr:sensor histidine kinase [Herbidospora galbida]TKK84253.1 sensor histidine kinase [Herbidospora galbida]
MTNRQGGFAFWVLLMTFPVLETVARPSIPRWAAVVAVIVLYLWTARRESHLALALLGLTSSAAALAFGGSWSFTLTMSAVATGAVVRRWPGVALLVPLTGIAVLAAIRSDVGAMNVAFSGWGVFVAGLVPWIIVQLWDTIAELQATRKELARVAVSEERLRFSRDLHDLLGHTLSVMVVKAEVVRRLAPRDGEAAARQAADIEEIGRQALTQVRAAVTGYRGRGLDAELTSARDALAAAGIELTVRSPGSPLAPETDALLGWAVREGVTNVIRHSTARTCAITLVVGEGESEGAELTIADDGAGVTGPASGNGLGGLRERVEAAGGRFAAGNAPAGGFRLTVGVPEGATP